MRGLLNQVRQPNLFLLFETCPTRVCGSGPHPSHPHHLVHWGVFIPCTPTPTRVCGSVLTLCAPTPPRALGRVHTLRAQPPRALEHSHPARPPPRALGRVHTLRSHTTPCIGARPHLRAHTAPCIGAHPARPHHPAHWGVFTPCAPPPSRALGPTSSHATLCPPLCSRRSPPTRYEKTHAAVRFVGRVRSI